MGGSVNSGEHQGLPRLRNHLFLRAEHLWELSILLAVAMLAATLVGLWVNKPFIVSTVGLVALVFPVAVSWLREAANVAQLRADKCRRLILLADGLGHEIAPAELAEVRAWGLGVKLDQAPFVRPYYSSTLLFGFQRLADMSAEAAFFTEQLAGRMATALKSAFCIALVAAIVALALIDFPGSVAQSSIVLGAKSVAIFLAFLISGDFLLIAHKYSDLRDAAQRAYQRCARLRTDGNVSADEVRAVVEDHGVSLTHCPPVPFWLYSYYRDELNSIYRQSHRVDK